MHHQYSFLSLFSPTLRVYLSKKPKYCSDTVVFLLPWLECPCFFIAGWRCPLVPGGGFIGQDVPGGGFRGQDVPSSQEEGLEDRMSPRPGRRVYRTGCPLVPGGGFRGQDVPSSREEGLEEDVPSSQEEGLEERVSQTTAEPSPDFHAVDIMHCADLVEINACVRHKCCT